MEVPAYMQYTFSSSLIHVGRKHTSVMICAQWDGLVMAFATLTTDDVVNFHLCVLVAQQTAANAADLGESIKTASVLGRQGDWAARLARRSCARTL